MINKPTLYWFVGLVWLLVELQLGKRKKEGEKKN